MTLPNFLIVGAAKSGTTTLYDLLCQHPDVFMPKWKEPAFFVGDYPRNARSLKEYESIFADAGGAMAVGEASTPYLYDREAPEKIRKTLKDPKIIMVLRNPVDMAYSLWGWMKFRFGFEELSFEEALESEEARMNDPEFRKNCIEWHASFYYYHRGLYFEQVKRYIDIFGRDRVLIHLFDDFVRDPIGVCRKTFEFLGVDPSFEPALKKRNPASAPKSRLAQRLLVNPPSFVQKAYDALPLPLRLRVYDAARFLHKLNLRPQRRQEMEMRTREMLTEKYRDDVARLESLIGMDLSAWRGQAAGK